MKFDTRRMGVPGDVREPSMLSVVPLEPVTPGEGGGGEPIPGFCGTALTLRSAPRAKPKTLGFVLACPQVPRWMSPEYGRAVDEAHSGKIRLEDYASEWFEKVIYLHRDDLKKAAKAPGGLAWTRALTQLGPAFDNAESDGCARTAARTQLYRAELGDDGLPARLSFEGVFYSLVWDAPPSKPAKVPAAVREITLAPLESRQAFSASARHKKQLAESARLGRAADPEGVNAKARAAHLAMVKKRGAR